jgi:hypothetical protein
MDRYCSNEQERSLGDTCSTLSAQEMAWCRVIVELPHHQGGLGIKPLPASGMAAFYSATVHMVSWLGSLPHASEWVAGQNLADPNTWNSSSLTTLKQFHDKLLTHYNCTEWAPPPNFLLLMLLHRGATRTVLALFPSLRLTFSLHCVLSRLRKMAKILFVRRYLYNFRSLIASWKTGCGMRGRSNIRLRTVCVTCTCFITPNRCP